MFWYVLAIIMFITGNPGLGIVFLIFGLLFSDNRR
jgi:hypothetical protein